jgi:hypothetical protein
VIEKVKNTLQEMLENNLPINIGSVAKIAGVSRTWIYNNPTLKNKIERSRLKEDKIHRIIELQRSIETRDKKIARLKHRNQQQKAIIKKLRQLLEVIYGKLYSNKQH